MRTFLLSIACLSMLTATTATAAPPAQLRGKSIIVSWSEERQQKVVGEDNLRNVGRNGEFSVYVSDQGRPFSRMHYSFAGGGGRLRAGNRDAVGGEGGGNRSVSFNGNTMNVVMRVGTGGARNLTVNISGDSCTAQVIGGKAEGASEIRAKSIVTGNQLQIVSIKTGPASCRIQSGNVFGN